MAAAATLLTSASAQLAAPVKPIPASQLAPYPPMHWHSWNTFCGENEVNEANMRGMADALISSGMAAAGYDMVNVVCNGWTGRHVRLSVCCSCCVCCQTAARVLRSPGEECWRCCCC